MSKLTFSRRGLSLWIVVAACFAVLSAGTASAQSDGHRIQICHKGQTIEVDVHAVPAHLDHGDTIFPCGSPPPCACGQEFDPVLCSSDGKIYGNPCAAACAGASGCEHFAVCSDIYNPVICNGVVYANVCSAKTAGCTGPFTLKCACGLIYLPVRCDDGITYVNACVAVCNQATGCTPIQ